MHETRDAALFHGFQYVGTCSFVVVGKQRAFGRSHRRGTRCRGGGTRSRSSYRSSYHSSSRIPHRSRCRGRYPTRSPNRRSSSSSRRSRNSRSPLARVFQVAPNAVMVRAIGCARCLIIGIDGAQITLGRLIALGVNHHGVPMAVLIGRQR